MPLSESPEASKLGQIKIDDLLYSIEIKMFKKHPVNDRRFEDKQKDKLAEFDETTLAKEVQKRIPSMNKNDLNNYKVWVLAIRNGILPHKENFLEELTVAFDNTVKAQNPTDSSTQEIKETVREKVDSGIDDIINPS